MAVAVSLAAVAAPAGCAIGAPEAGTEPADGCAALEGQTITLVAPASPGGGFDTLARVIAEPLGGELGAQVIVENRPGAGGLLAVNRLVNAPADGTQLALMSGTGAAASVLGGAEGADFALRDLSYIGRVAQEDTLLVTSPQGGTWSDALASDDFRFGSTGPGGTDYATATLLIEAFQLRGRIVTGFPGQSEAMLALLQGNIDGLIGTADDRRSPIESGEVVPILSITPERADVAPDAPAIGELDLRPEQRSLLDALLTLNELGRPLVGPAGIEPGTLECLRTAFAAVAQDPAVVARAADQRRRIGYASGQELDAVIGRIEALPPEFVGILREALGRS
ncbi:hypothetical protein GCM10009559_38650 [Pseudonocardia zijingensis]|jgi:tripartite-type tricarboxylate transporter receptor subunit TctC|uniref:Tripartite-type tricarboxylate transporter receptor subunit TctC n=2 Tax=Pseudonocardia zijingensis TaxID=153376 RepID=A0ABP4AX36_9PSEU